MKQKLFTARALSLGLLMAFILPLSAQAGEPRLLGTHGAWSSYVFIENGNKVCYMASKPSKSTGDYTRRGEVFALITHRPAENTKNVFSYITGYSYKNGSEAVVEIDGKRHVMFTQGDTAWAPDEDGDKKMANAIRKGSKMSVRGKSTRGTATKDVFSLKGSGAAHDRISEECGY